MAGFSFPSACRLKEKKKSVCALQLVTGKLNASIFSGVLLLIRRRVFSSETGEGRGGQQGMGMLGGVSADLHNRSTSNPLGEVAGRDPQQPLMDFTLFGPDETLNL